MMTVAISLIGIGCAFVYVIIMLAIFTGGDR